MPMGFAVDPGPLPFRTVRDAEKWSGRLAAGTVDIRGEGCEMPEQLVRVASVEPITHEEAKEQGLYVPSIYRNRRLIVVHLEALNG